MGVSTIHIHINNNNNNPLQKLLHSFTKAMPAKHKREYACRVEEEGDRETGRSRDLFRKVFNQQFLKRQQLVIVHCTKCCAHTDTYAEVQPNRV